MLRYGIVIIGYKNSKGIERLLRALSEAEYENDSVLLIISIDYSDESAVLRMAEDYQWEYGEKIVIKQKKRLGLREHVLKCGDYLNSYNLDSLIVFEDDMFPSKDFFLFSRAASEKYSDDDNIAGISLYTRTINQTVMREFSPLLDKGENYFFQYAQSRGQIWFKKQWNEFRSWYENNRDWITDCDYIPKDVLGWPDSSWLKYHIKYCIENNKYFVYPYISHSTCFGEPGVHLKDSTNQWQVSISHQMKREYDFIDFNEEALKYDAFFENEGLAAHLGLSKDDLTVDLYGGRTKYNTQYVLTTKTLDCSIIKSWANKLRPHEMNVIHNVEGNEIFLYKLSSCCSGIKEVKNSPTRKYILYGAGNDGAEALRWLGRENVLCYCDTHKCNETIDGIPVIGLDELKEKAENAQVVLSISKTQFVIEVVRELTQLGVDAVFWRDVVGDIIRREGKKYNSLNKRPNFAYSEEYEYLVSYDRYQQAGELTSYFWQDLWAARHIHKERPENHYDIGSRVDGFITHLLSFGQHTTMIDIRPLRIEVDGLDFVQADATNLDGIDDESIESLSALCSLEHFGLGRYGDPIDPEACFKCFEAIQNKTKSGGNVYISVPIGKERLEFNAHRVFLAETIIESFNKMNLVEFSSCYYEKMEKNIDPHKYDDWDVWGGDRFGLFHFRKI